MAAALAVALVPAKVDAVGQRIVGWGFNTSGQATPPGGSDYLDIAGGQAHSVALDQYNHIVVWGEPLGAATPSGNYDAIAAGQGYSLALKSDGVIVAWGDPGNTYGQLNVPAPTDFNEFVAIAAGTFHNLALREDGSIVAWGRDLFGEVSGTPTDLGYKAIAAGSDFSVAIKADGSLVAWGNDSLGQATPHPGTGYTAIAAGARHGVALAADGSIATWGSITLGIGNPTPPEGSGYVAIAAGNFFALALDSTGSIHAWGDDSNDQVSDAPTGIGFTAIAAGGTHGLALALDQAEAKPKPLLISPASTIFQEGSPITLTAIFDPANPSFVPPGLDHLEFHYAEHDETAPYGYGTPQLITEDASQPFTFNWTYAPVGLSKVTATAVYVDGDMVEGPFASSYVTVLPNADLATCFIFFLDYFLGLDGNGTTASTIPRVLAQLSGLELDLFRTFRDEVLASTPAGQYYSDLYDRTSPLLIASVARDPSLLKKSYDALIAWTPAIQALVDNQGGSVTITPEMAANAQEILASLRAVASDELGGLMDSETSALDPATWSGMSIGQLLDRVEAQVRPPPAISAQPVARTVVIGADATFSVQPTGAGPFTYQWRRNGVDISGATSDTLTVSDVQPGGGGNYSVVVSNPFGSVTSNPATLALDTTPRLINVSCLASAGAGDSTLVVGFYLNGTGSKTLIIRGVGARLAQSPFNLPNTVADPQISVYDKDGMLIATNDDWDSALAPDFSRLGAFDLVDGSKDAALKVTLAAPDRYTVHLVNTAAVADAIIEVYDFSRDSATRLTNVSSRLNMKAGETVTLGTALIANPVPVLTRAIGPGLAPYILEDPSILLPDPFLRAFVNGAEIASNDDWELATKPYFGAAGAFPIADGSKDAAIRVAPTPGSLTIQATGKGGSGVAIIEIYESP